MILAAGLVAATASPAMAKKAALSCASTPQSTLVENSAVRVFSWHGRTYACVRPAGRPKLVAKTDGAFQQSGPPNGHIPVAAVVLAGGFVGWEQTNASGQLAALVLDVRRGGIWQADAGGSQTQIAAYVLNSHGTAVTLDYTDALCIDHDVLTEVTPQGARTTLDSAQNFGSSGSGCSPSLTNPITALGLSSAGDFAYWQTNGTFKGAPIA
jgi:hypothetical protein